MATCPAGHASATLDYCDECGAAMTAAPVVATGPSAGPPSSASPAPGSAGSAPPGPARRPARPSAPNTDGRCPACDTELEPNSRFCEACGHDSMRPAPSRPAPPAVASTDSAWSLVATADRAWFDEVRGREGPDIEAVQFPHYCPARTFALTAPQTTVGRRSRSRGIDPEVDLTGPPLDPGVSSLHAVLLRRSDGGWDLVDVGSRNGTVVNGSADPITPNVPVRLADGDRIKIGAWTVLTVAVGRSAGA